MLLIINIFDFIIIYVLFLSDNNESNYIKTKILNL